MVLDLFNTTYHPIKKDLNAKELYNELLKRIEIKEENNYWYRLQIDVEKDISFCCIIKKTNKEFYNLNKELINSNLYSYLKEISEWYYKKNIDELYEFINYILFKNILKDLIKNNKIIIN